MYNSPLNHCNSELLFELASSFDEEADSNTCDALHLSLIQLLGIMLIFSIRFELRRSRNKQK